MSPSIISDLFGLRSCSAYLLRLHNPVVLERPKRHMLAFTKIFMYFYQHFSFLSVLSIIDSFSKFNNYKKIQGAFDHLYVKRQCSKLINKIINHTTTTTTTTTTTK